MRVCIVYDTKRVAGATRAVAERIAATLNREAGADVALCRPRDPCPDPSGFDLVIVGTPIYYERPMRSITEFLDRHDGLRGLKVAVYITCIAACDKLPSPIRNAITKWYLKSVLKHVKGEIIACKAFKGWLWKPSNTVLQECAEWSREVLDTLRTKARIRTTSSAKASIISENP